jgi:hypothetical protein
MAFTEKEFQNWHAEKRKREHRADTVFKSEPIAICINCHNPFGFDEGMITDDVSICYICAD